MAREEIKALLSTPRPDRNLLKATSPSHSNRALPLDSRASSDSSKCRGSEDNKLQRGCTDAIHTLAQSTTEEQVKEMHALQVAGEWPLSAKRECLEKDVGPSAVRASHARAHVHARSMQARALDEMREVMRCVIASCPLSPPTKETSREHTTTAAVVTCGYDAGEGSDLLHERDLKELAVNWRLDSLMAPIQVLLSNMEERRNRPKRKHTQPCNHIPTN